MEMDDGQAWVLTQLLLCKLHHPCNEVEPHVLDHDPIMNLYIGAKNSIRFGLILVLIEGG
jgi:hypothetical protein